jgi:predicted TIM-barrel fold metal-dependent hydrolase
VARPDVDDAPVEVIDGDGHLIEPADLWVGEYMEPSLRARAPRVALDDGKLYYADGRPFAHPGTFRDAVLLGFERDPDAPPRYGDGRPGAGEPQARLRDLDLEGIDRVVLYPTLATALSFEPDPMVAAAMARAYNRWLRDWCDASPGRLFGAAILPVQTVETAVEELRFGRAELGLTAAMVRPHPYGGRTIFDPDWDPLWAAAQELDCPIGVHGTASWPTAHAGADRFTKAQREMAHVTVHTIEQELAFVGLIRTGVFERFPRLRMAFLESGGGWVPTMLDRMERHFDQNFDLPRTPQRPRDYFRENCWIAFEPVESCLGLLADAIGPDKILWGSDYPHSDGFFPGVVATLETSMAGIPPEARAAVLSGGARAFYRI